MTHKHKLAYFFLFVFVCFLLFIFNAYFVPFGKVSYKKDFNNKFSREFNIYKLGPDDRLKDDNIIISEPLYFYVRTPRDFDYAKVNLAYKFNQDLKKTKNYDIKLGVLRNRENWSFDLKSVFNSIIESLDEDNYIYEQDLLFYQREKNFSSLEDYLRFNNFEDLVLYNYGVDYNYYIDDYLASDEGLELKGLRGSQKFLLYLDRESLAIDFYFKTLLDTDSDISINLYQKSEKVFQDSISVDQDFVYNLKLDNLERAVYSLEIISDDSYLIDKMETSLSKLVLVNKLNIFSEKQNFSFYASKGQLRLKALDAACLGDIYINNQRYEVDEIFIQHLFNLDQDLNLIEFNSCGFLLEGNLLFSSSADAWFNPLISSLNSYEDFTNSNYLIADYKKAEQMSDHYLSSIDFDLRSIDRHNKEYQFLISAPFLSDNKEGVFIEIDSIEVVFYKNNILDKVKALINSFF